MLIGKSESTLIVDVDDVITYTTPLWFKRIMENIESFEDYFNMDLIPDPEDYDYYRKDQTGFFYPYCRETYFFADWLCRKDLTEAELKECTEMIMELHINDFYTDPDLYFTNIANSLRRTVSFQAYDTQKLVFLTRVPLFDPELMKTKTKLLKDYFAEVSKNCEIVFVDKNEKKSDIANEYSDISLIIDDELSNVYDYINNCRNIECSQILIPMSNYNIDFDPNMMRMAKDKNIAIQYYKY